VGAGKKAVLTQPSRCTGKWVLEKSSSYTTKSLYRQTSFWGVISRRMNEIWGSKLSLKVRIFLWKMFHDKLQTVEQLKKKNWKGEINCVLYGRVEDVNHICLGV
jgi:hypothetical protein